MDIPKSRNPYKGLEESGGTSFRTDLQEAAYCCNSWMMGFQRLLRLLTATATCNYWICIICAAARNLQLLFPLVPYHPPRSLRLSRIFKVVKYVGRESFHQLQGSSHDSRFPCCPTSSCFCFLFACNTCRHPHIQP